MFIVEILIKGVEPQDRVENKYLILKLFKIKTA